MRFYHRSSSSVTTSPESLYVRIICKKVMWFTDRSCAGDGQPGNADRRWYLPPNNNAENRHQKHTSVLRYTFPILIWSHTNKKTVNDLHSFYTRKALPLAFLTSLLKTYLWSCLFWYSVNHIKWQRVRNTQSPVVICFAHVDPKNTNIPLTQIIPHGIISQEK